MGKEFSSCDRCGKVIDYGNAHVTISRNVEYAELVIATNQKEIQVIDSEVIFTLCAHCGHSFDARTIAAIIISLPPNSSRIIEN